MDNAPSENKAQSPVGQQNPSFWAKALQTFKSVYRECLILGVFGIMLPKLVFEYVFGSFSHVIFRQFNDGMKSDDFLDLFSVLSRFFMQYFIWTLVLALLCICVYFAIIHITSDYYRGQPLPTLAAALRRGIRSAIPKGVTAVFLFAVTLLMTQLIFPPLILFLLPGFMIPVLLAVKKISLWHSIREALSINYGKKFPGGFWALMFKMLGIAAFFYLAMLLIFYSNAVMLNLDAFLPLPSFFWRTAINESSPITYGYVLAIFIKAVLIPVATSLLAVVTTSFYYWILALQSPIPSQGIEV